MKQRLRATSEDASVYDAVFAKSMEIYNSTDRIAYPRPLGGYVYNFWQDKDHVRGVWRRCTQASYDAGTPAWETLLDIDAMSRTDNIRWVFKGASALEPTSTTTAVYDLFLVSLSDGGGDATEVREFDMRTRSFTDLRFPASKGSVSYVDANTMLVGRDFGEGSMTASGYPRQVRLWKRGTPLDHAVIIHQGERSDVSCSGYVLRDAARGTSDAASRSYTIINRSSTFFTGEKFVWEKGKVTKLDLPDDCDIAGLQNGQLIVQLKSAWRSQDGDYAQGALVSVHMEQLLRGKHLVRGIVEPGQRSSISDIALTKNTLIVVMLTDVKNELRVYRYDERGKGWEQRATPVPSATTGMTSDAMYRMGTINVVASSDESDRYYFIFTNFLTPTTLCVADAVANTCTELRSLPATFDANGMKVEQYSVRSKDGTMVPYFVVRGAGSASGATTTSAAPTLLYAYGGFEVSMLPFYSATLGHAWLARGGVYVLANIRGGGEYGPEWHRAGLKEKRQNVYDDFHAVAEDLRARGITAKGKLGIMGGSNGGLLMGVAFTQRPDLYNAVVCQVPLLDMKRYTKLLAGASWEGEYGDPDKPEQWEYIKRYSPYHNLQAKPAVAYPEVLFTTSTRD
ncbi:MAG: prolyl oligopeptidase family serine peptidase, partial [Candidatus Kapaibacterium sp.]